MIIKELIEDRINNFWGYGNLNSPIWFIGMEEGFTGNQKDLENRFLRTKGKSVLDCHKDMLDVPDHIKFYRGSNPPLQKTISKLIATIFYLQGKSNFDNDEIRKFQGTKFGRLDSNHCSLEFLPLPVNNTNTNSWKYAAIGIDYLLSRNKYQEKIFPIRIKLFRQLIQKHSPKVIIFYSLTFKSQWESIIGSFANNLGDETYACQNGDTCYFIISHPARKGLTNATWEKVCLKMKRYLDERNISIIN